MKFFTRIAVAGVCSLVCYCSGFAQPGLLLPTLQNLPTGSLIEVPVRVQNFVKINGVQSAILWNKNVITFNGIINYNLPGLDNTDFNTNEALDSGWIRVLWTSPQIQTGGTTIADQTIIFTMSFEVVGPINSGTAINFGEIPPLTLFEIVNSQGQSFNLNTALITQGSVCVGCTVAGNEPENLTIDLSVYPNPPSNNFLEFQLTLREAANLRWQILNSDGRLMYESTPEPMSSGRNSLRHDLSGLAPGQYFLSVLTENGKITRSFLFQ